MRSYLVTGIAALALAACGGSDAPTETEIETPVETATVEPDAPAAEAGLSTLQDAIDGDWRSADNSARDTWRHPAETLAFFEVEPGETLIEIYPGGGWYAEILAPFVEQTGGRYIAANFGNPEGDARFLERFADETVYGALEVTALNDSSGPMTDAGTVDTVLSFRNVHNWMSRGFEAKVFEDAYAALKPGGVFGVVEHRLPSSADQDPQARTGYVHQDYVISLAEEAGFEFAGSSEINANSADTADHPFGVWTLPPVSVTEDREGNAPEGFDAQKYLDIGESDRFTLKFVKPAS